MLIWEDAAYGLIKWEMDIELHGHEHVDFTNPDFVAYAESFGAKGARVRGAGDLFPALEAALASDGVTVGRDLPGRLRRERQADRPPGPIGLGESGDGQMSKRQPDDVATVNPAIGAVIARYATDDPARVEALVAEADRGFRAWRATPVERRAEMLHRLSAVLRDDRDRLAGLVTAEMGKTIAKPAPRSRNAPASRPGTPNAGRPCWPTSRRRSRAGSLRVVSAARHRARRHAVELPAVAGAARGRADDGRFG